MNLNRLKGTIPFKVIEQLPAVISKYSINTPIRLSHFLSQCYHESNNFQVVFENLNYSKDGLLKIFPKYFTELTALQYAKKPEKIANKVYANRMGNGDELSGDGYKYRGRGYIQCTGKNNYTIFDKEVDDDIINNPDLIATKYPLLSGGWFWNTNNLNPIADGGGDDIVIMKVRKRVNGGTIGLQPVINEFNKIYPLLK